MIGNKFYTWFKNYYQWVGGAFNETLLLPLVRATSGLRAGAIRYDEDTDTVETYDGTNWNPIPSATGFVPSSRTITINGETYDLTINRIWTVGNVRTDSSYSNPSWITALAWSKITNTPTTLSGYGITDGVVSGRTLTINGTTQDLSANRTYNVGTVTSVGLSAPAAFNVSGSPVTGSGTLALTAAGLASQYVRGDGTLANFPTSTGGGSSVSYYLNGSTNQGTFAGSAFYEMSKSAILGAGTNFTINTNGYIASFITDAGDPGLTEIPAGNWNLELYFSASSGGGNPTFYVELAKWDGSGFTAIASSQASPDSITGGTNIDAYFTALAVPQTTLSVTDRLALRIYVNHSGRTITLHTEDANLCQVITTFSTGLTALNGLTAQVQNLATGTSGNDFNIVSAGSTHTFNIPTASATNRGALSSTDWSTFNAKQAALTLTTTGSSGASTLVGATLNVPEYTLSGLGGAPTSRQLTINGTAFDLSADRSWTVGDVRTDSTYSNPSWITALAWSKITNTPTTLNGYGITDGVRSVGLTTSTTGVTIGSTPVTGSGNITIDIATASGSAIGLLSSSDWTTFNNKQNALTLTTSGSSGAATLVGATLNIPQYQAAGNYITALTGEVTASGPGSASATLTNSAVIGKVLTGLNLTGGGTIAATDSILQAFGKIQNQISAMVGGVMFQGTWNANTNTPTLASGTGTKGHYYIVDVSGTTTLDGKSDWRVGDWAIYNGTAWDKVDNTDAVSSVNGFTGAVSLSTSHINEGTNLYYTDARARAAITLTTTGNSGSATYSGGTLNVPTYTLAGLGGVASTRTLTINGTAFDLSADRSWSVGTVTSVGLSSATSGVTIGSTPVTGSGTITLAIATASGSQNGLLSSTDWTTFNNKQNALTNPVTGTGTTNYLPKFTSSSAIGNSVIYENSGDIGIGFTSTFGKLSINVNAAAPASSGNMNNGFTVANTNGGRAINIGVNESGAYNYIQSSYVNNADVGVDLAFFRGASEQMRLTSTGLGIGTSSPAVKLQVTDISSTNPSLLILEGSNSGRGLEIKLGTDGLGANGSAVIYNTRVSAPYGEHIWQQAGTQRMRLDYNGNLGLGVTPSAWSTGSTLDISTKGSLHTSSAIGLLLGRNVYYDGSYKYKATGIATALIMDDGGYNWFTAPSGTAGNAISFTQAMTLDASGNLGLGTTSISGSYRLTLNGNASTNTGGIIIRQAGTDVMYIGNIVATNTTDFEFWNPRNGYTRFATNNTERMRITSGGNVGIGTTTDAGYKLDVNGTGRFSGNVNIEGSTYPFISIVGNNTVYGGGVKFFGSATQYAEIYGEYEGTNNGQLFFRTRKAGTITTALQIASSGAATFSSSIQTGGISGGSTVPWRLGTASAGAPGSPTITIEVEVNGSTYHIGASAV